MTYASSGPSFDDIPCHCGSGRPLSQCHGRDGEVTPRAPEDVLRRRRQWFSAQADAAYQITLTLGKRESDALLKIAREEMAFILELDDFSDAPDDSPWDSLLACWFHYRWWPSMSDEPDAETAHPPGVACLVTRRRLRRRTRQFIEASLIEPFSFYRIEEVREYEGVVMQDLLSDRSDMLYDLSLSVTARPNTIMFGQLLDFRGLTIAGAMAPIGLPPTASKDVLELTDTTSIRDGSGLEEGGVRDILTLRIFGALAGRELERPIPTLTNTDGEPLEPTTSRYGFDPDARDEIVEVLLQDPEMEDSGTQDERPAKVDWVVEREGDPMFPNVRMGGIEVNDDELTLFTNSANRHTALRARVEEAVGDRLEYTETEVADPEEYFAAGAGDAERGELVPGAEHSGIIPPVQVPPEIKAFIRDKIMSWLDTEVPALGGLTPRDAVKDPDLRGEVALLLDDWEYRTDPRGDNMGADFDAMRSELGLPVRRGGS